MGKEMQHCPSGFSTKRLPMRSTDKAGVAEKRVGCLRCIIGGSSATEVDFFVELASRHPARVMNPDQAEIFIVPFDFMRSNYFDTVACPAHGDPRKTEKGY